MILFFHRDYQCLLRSHSRYSLNNSTTCRNFTSSSSGFKQANLIPRPNNRPPVIRKPLFTKPFSQPRQRDHSLGFQPIILLLASRNRIPAVVQHRPRKPTFTQRNLFVEPIQWMRRRRFPLSMQSSEVVEVQTFDRFVRMSDAQKLGKKRGVG